MKKSLWLMAFMVAGVMASGCGPTHYNIKVNGYTDPAAPALIAPGGAFFVMENKDAKNPLLEKEVKEKINRLLEKQGYRLVPYERADYYLFFSFGLGGDRSTTVVMPDYSSSVGFGIGTGYWGRRSAPYVFGGPYFSFPASAESVSLYDRWLLLNVVDAKYYREQGRFQTVWVGEARSTGTSSDLRTMLNYLLLADFREFGQNTGKAVSLEISEPEAQVFGPAPGK